jgi:hypothetical protein
MITPNYLENTSSRDNWRVDARDHLLLGLYDMACAACVVQRRMVITDCACLDPLSIARLTAAGKGYVTCKQ